MATVRQELPPPGGFSRVQYERVPLKKFISGPKKCLIYLGISAVGWYGYLMDKERINRLSVERKDAEFSVFPLLLAESDRIRMKTFRRLRDEEARIMKDVPGWEVGKYKGDPVYKTLKPDEWYDADMDLAMKPHIKSDEFLFATFVEESH